jgi:hypothetical protein
MNERECDRKPMRWLLTLLLLTGCSLPPGDVVRLELSPTPDMRQGFCLELDGSICRGQIGELRMEQHLSPTELEQLMHAVDQPAAFQDCDSGAPESQVLYTRIQLGQRVARWRGLPPPQARVAEALLASPIGPTLRQGLTKVQERKAAR